MTKEYRIEITQSGGKPTLYVYFISPRERFFIKSFATYEQALSCKQISEDYNSLIGKRTLK